MSGEPPADDPPGSSPRRFPLLPFVAVLLLYSLPIGGNAEVTPYPNELSRILLAVSLAVDRSISVDGAVGAYGTEEDLAAREGRSYSDKAPGLAFAGAPIAWASTALLPRWGETPYPDYWPLRNLLTWILAALPGALLPFLLLRGRTPLEEGETALAALLAVTSPVFIYAGTLFSHVPAAALVAAAWALALDLGGGPRRRAPWKSFAAGAAAGLAVATEYPTAILLGVLLGAMIAGGRGAGRIAAFASGAILGLAPALAYNSLAFGSPIATGYAFKTAARDAAVHATGWAGVTFPSAERLFGVLFSASRGLLFYCPLLLLVPSGIVAMARRDRPGAWALVAACGGYGFSPRGSSTGWEAGGRRRGISFRSCRSSFSRWRTPSPPCGITSRGGRSSPCSSPSPWGIRSSHWPSRPTSRRASRRRLRR
jgi:hypothetical protein